MAHDEQIVGNDEQEINGTAIIVQRNGARRQVKLRADLLPEDGLPRQNEKLNGILDFLVQYSKSDAIIVINQSAAPAELPLAEPRHHRHEGPQGELARLEYVTGVVRGAVNWLRQNQMLVTHEAVATRIGIPTRSLKRACQFHHLAWQPWPPDWI